MQKCKLTDMFLDTPFHLRSRREERHIAWTKPPHSPAVFENDSAAQDKDRFIFEITPNEFAGRAIPHDYG
jgi:hypothetical protein